MFTGMSIVSCVIIVALIGLIGWVWNSKRIQKNKEKKEREEYLRQEAVADDKYRKEQEELRKTIPQDIVFELEPDELEQFYKALKIFDIENKKHQGWETSYDKFDFWSTVMEIHPAIKTNQEIKNWNKKGCHCYVGYKFDTTNLMIPKIIVFFKRTDVR